MCPAPDWGEAEGCGCALPGRWQTPVTHRYACAPFTDRHFAGLRSLHHHGRPSGDPLRPGRHDRRAHHDGAFFAIAPVVAADLVPPHKKASAILMMFAGLTVVNVVGVPLDAYVGRSVGWRVTFLIIAAIGLLGLAGIVKVVPRSRD
jgi:Major Facilitator Superfamily